MRADGGKGKYLHSASSGSNWHLVNKEWTTIKAKLTLPAEFTSVLFAFFAESDGKIEVRLEASETAFIIAVKDNGKGIKDEDKSQIFLPNFTTKTGGSGVGLSLTYNIVQSVGGKISFESQVGEGTEFVIELPK